MKEFVSIGKSMIALVAASAAMGCLAATLEVGPNRAYRTIQSAADAAKPGDTVLIDSGVYREWVKPSVAGTEQAPITFRAREKGKTVISGADVITDWTKRADGLWEKTILLNDFAGRFNPFTDMLHGDFFRSNRKRHPRTGLVFNGKRLKFRQSVREILTARRPFGPKDCLVNLAGFTTAGRTRGGETAAERTKGDLGWWTPYGRDIGWILPGTVVRFAKVRVGEKIDIHYSCGREPDEPSAVIEVREGTPTGPVLARVEVTGTDSWMKYGTVSVTPSKCDVTCDLCFVFLAPDLAGKITGGYTLESDGSIGRIVAAFPGDPAAGCAEFVTRPACFYPVRLHCDYQTLDGLVLRDAGPNWAPPTAEQVGVVGTHWSRGWKIENCTIHGSGASGVTLGKGGEIDNRAEPLSAGYQPTVRRAAANGFDRIGHHLVANCTIYDCQQVGICGSLGAVFSTVRDCDIHHCCWRKPFGGDEQGGIKIHGAVDFTVSRCHIHHCEGNGGVWLDWMAQGVLIEDCVLHDNFWDVCFECDHGPITVRNCTLLSKVALWAYAQSVCLANNRIYGTFTLKRDLRKTPYFVPHTVTVAKEYQHCFYGDFRVFNNVMIHPFPMNTLVKEWPMIQSGNVIVPRDAWQIDGGKLQFGLEGERKRAVETALSAPVPKMAESVVTRQAFR